MSEPVNQVKRTRSNKAETVLILVGDPDGEALHTFKVPLDRGVQIYIDTDKDVLVGPIRIDKFGNAFK